MKECFIFVSLETDSFESHQRGLIGREHWRAPLLDGTVFETELENLEGGGKCCTNQAIYNFILSERV